MEDIVERKAFYIAAYFNDLEIRVAFLNELYAMGRRDEALLLCCRYIEALGSRLYPEQKSKAKNYCSILIQHGGNEIWQMIHPKQIKNVFSSNKLFNSSLVVLCQLIDTIGNQLISAHDLSALLAPSLNEDQKK